MNLKRRLQNLECRPFRRPVSQRDDFVVAPVLAEALQKLNLPLPKQADGDERGEALRLMVAAQARTRIDRADTGGWDTLRDYALAIHEKYGSVRAGCGLDIDGVKRRY